VCEALVITIVAREAGAFLGQRGTGEPGGVQRRAHDTTLGLPMTEQLTT
jgi:hypothetical protein